MKKPQRTGDSGLLRSLMGGTVMGGKPITIKHLILRFEESMHGELLYATVPI